MLQSNRSIPEDTQKNLRMIMMKFCVTGFHFSEKDVK